MATLQKIANTRQVVDEYQILNCIPPRIICDSKQSTIQANNREVFVNLLSTSSELVTVYEATKNRFADRVQYDPGGESIKEIEA